MNIQEMIDKRATLVKQSREILDAVKAEERAMTAEEKNKFEAMDKEIDQLNESIERERKLSDLEKRMKEPVEVPVDTRGNTRKETPEEAIENFRNFLRTGEKRALAVGGNGAAVVPTFMADKVAQGLADASAMRQLATLIKTSGDYEIPVISGGTAYLVAEGNAITTSDPTLASKTLTGYNIAWNTIVSALLVQDSKFDLESLLVNQWARVTGAKEETYFVAGTGSSQPEGVLVGGSAGATTASATAITADELINFHHSLKPQYRMKGSYIFSDATLKAIRKLADSSGRYLWEPGLASGEPNSLFGRPVYASAGCPDQASLTTFGAFGDMSYYWIADRGDMSLIVDPYSKSANAQVQYTGFHRVDGIVTLDEAIKTITPAV